MAAPSWPSKHSTPQVYIAASAMSGQGRTRIGAPFRVLVRPAAPSQRSPMTGWSITPNTGRPRWTSAIKVPNIGLPVMNDLVPSIGSSSQTYSASV